MDPVNKAIWQKFHVHHGDTVPFVGFDGTRRTLAALFAELGYTKGAEVGVARGNYSEILLKSNPKLQLLCIDPWKAFSRNSDSHMENVYQSAKDRLKGLNATLIRKTSIDAAKEIPDGSLDFVYIDAMHDFDNVIQDIITWVPKVRRDGIVSGHDYEIAYSDGVMQAVDAYTRVHNIGMYYVTPKDPPRSWFWVRR